MKTLLINDNSPAAQRFVEYAKSLPFVEEQPQKTIQQALEENPTMSVDEFCDELDARIRRHFDHHA